MIWVIVLAAIGVAGVVMVVCYAVWLAHKAGDVFGELTVVGQRLGQLGDLAGQIRIPDFERDPGASTEQARIVSATNDVR